MLFPYFDLPWHIQRQILDSLNPLDVESLDRADFFHRISPLQRRRKPHFKQIQIKFARHDLGLEPFVEEVTTSNGCVEMEFLGEGASTSTKVLHVETCPHATVERTDKSISGVKRMEETVLKNLHEESHLEDLAWEFVLFSVAEGKVDHLNVEMEVISSRMQIPFKVRRITIKRIRDAISLCKVFRFLDGRQLDNVSLFGIRDSKCSIDMPSIAIQFPSVSILHIRGLDVDLRPEELPTLSAHTIALRTLNYSRHDVMRDLNTMIKEWYSGRRQLQEIQLLCKSDDDEWTPTLILAGLPYKTEWRCSVVKDPVNSKGGLLVAICTRDLILIQTSPNIIELLQKASQNLRSCFAIQPPLCIHR